ncbi:hypothetical protein OQA88_5430 [Cercophora sp. LCS_1]
MAEDLAAVVFDTGGCTTFRAGFAGDDSPRAVFPRICTLGARNYKDTFIGDEVATNARIPMTTTHPTSSGILDSTTNWDDIEKIWHHAYYDRLNIEPRDHALLLIDQPDHRPITVGKSAREMVTQIAFETFEVPALCIAYAPVLSMYFVQGNTGLSIHSCDRHTAVTPVYEGLVVRHGVERGGLAGQDVTKYMQDSMLWDRGITVDEATARDIKGKMCYVPLDYEREVRKKGLEKYTLPDGRVVDVGVERIMGPQGLFEPAVLGSPECSSLLKMVEESLGRCDEAVRAEILRNVALSGGNFGFGGMAERVGLELSRDIPPGGKFVVNAPRNPHQAWVGGSILASLSTFEQMLVRKEEYDEWGPCLGLRKFL